MIKNSNELPLKNDIVFLMGGNDLEMKVIKALLDENGIEYKDKNLSWGAKVDAYKEELNDLFTAKKDIYGLELEGAGNGDYTQVKSMDHHGDRSQEQATILQVLAKLGIKPTLYYKLVAANDNAYIPGIIRILEEEGIKDKEEQQKWINQIRLEDRQAQGIDSKKEIEAEEAVKNLKKYPELNDLIVVKLPHSKSATVTDRLFGTQNFQNILILSGDGEVNYFGNGELCQILKNEFEGWNGGSGLGKKQEIAYWGGYPNQNKVEEFVSNYFKKK